MATNDVIVLNSILEERKTQTGSALSDSDHFELFTFEQLLKNYDLSYDELLSGKTGGSDDGGIDGFFAFVNGELLDEDTELERFKKNPLLEMFLVQAKQSTSFGENALDRAIATVADIFDLTKDMTALQNFYSPALIEKADVFRKAYLTLAGRHPELRIAFVYASKGDTAGTHPKVRNKGATLKAQIETSFSGARVDINFIGARELLDAARLEKTYTLQLKFLENYISRGDDNYVVLSTIKDYFNFLTDETGNLRRYVFESNVRDYQGDVEVNKEIRQTLDSEGGLDFWWLNNGITVLASKASIAGKSITLDDVQVVNGLQTTETIHNYLREARAQDDPRAILIKIIVTRNAEARDRIIKATNYQTKIPDASLRATDRIQRNIEDYFLSHGWFYDRRKNYYKNLGQPVDRIISIPYLAQSVMAVLLRETNNSRARPSSLIKRESDYARVFDESLNLGVYLFCARLMKRIDAFIRAEAPEFSWYEKSNLRFHLAMLVTVRLLGAKQYSSRELETISFVEPDQGVLSESLKDLVRLAGLYSEPRGYALDRICKSKEFDDNVLDVLC